MQRTRIAYALVSVCLTACSGQRSSTTSSLNPGESPDRDAGNTPEDDGGAESACEDAVPCGDACCRSDEVCAAGDLCVPAQAPCTDNDDCQHDTFCADGACTPYGAAGAPDFDETCQTSLSLSEIAPVVQCRWEGPPASDPHPEHRHVMSTTMVVDFDEDGDAATLSPSVVFASYPFGGSGYTQPGVLRVISGNDCRLQWSADDAADAVSAVSPVALADLTADGRAEIIAAAHGGGLLAFTLDVAKSKLIRLWRSGVCAEGARTDDFVGGADRWSGPSVHDLDDDGVPEIVYGATVYDRDGCLRSLTQEFPAYSQGVIPVVADLDGDARAELIAGDAVRTWSPDTNAWVAHPAFVPTVALSAGQVAVAELGEFPVAGLSRTDYPEIVVVSNGYVRVQTLGGEVVFGPVAIPGGGTGGAPTVADFDGDGRREIGVAGGSAYVVFDLDCVSDGDPAGCGGAASTTGVLWQQRSQDASSNVTGSSVFDFDADGRAEVAYGDECYFRIYDGATGAVVASLGNTSLTTYENPVIADTDGDFHTEIVICSNGLGGYTSCPAQDPLFPPAASGMGQGVTILKHEDERWAASRPVWNQHAYSVTHVGDGGAIPRTSAVEANWSDAALNNFRQNDQGALEARGIGDLTVSDGGTECSPDGATLKARVCNRGTLPVPAGLEVAFVDGDNELCRGVTEQLLQVGACSVARCMTELVPASLMVQLAVDPEANVGECYEHNNAGRTMVEGCPSKD